MKKHWLKAQEANVLGYSLGITIIDAENRSFFTRGNGIYTHTNSNYTSDGYSAHTDITNNVVSDNIFIEEDQNGNVTFDFHRKESLFGCQEYLKTWTVENGFSWKKVELLTSLIFLNIASLHHYPYSNLLYYLGKYNLKKAIEFNG